MFMCLFISMTTNKVSHYTYFFLELVEKRINIVRINRFQVNLANNLLCEIKFQKFLPFFTLKIVFLISTLYSYIEPYRSASLRSSIH